LESACSGNLDRDDVTVMLFEATTRTVSLADSLKAPWRFLRNLFSDRVTIRGPQPSEIQASTPSETLSP
jgi:hypothetical protein